MIDYDELKAFMKQTNPVVSNMGFAFTEIKKGFARGEVALSKEIMNPIGSVHGGVLFTLADTVGGTAAITYGSSCTTVTGNISYLNAAMGCEKLVVTGTPIKVGRKLAVMQVDIENEKGTDIAVATMTYHFMEGKMPISFDLSE